jgi:hypothetical protein
MHDIVKGRRTALMVFQLYLRGWIAADVIHMGNVRHAFKIWMGVDATAYLPLPID